MLADISMIGYLMFPKHEASFDFTISHTSMAAWLDDSQRYGDGGRLMICCRGWLQCYVAA
jgi:hypothetical protein